MFKVLSHWVICDLFSLYISVLVALILCSFWRIDVFIKWSSTRQSLATLLLHTKTTNNKLEVNLINSVENVRKRGNKVRRLRSKLVAAKFNVSDDIPPMSGEYCGGSYSYGDPVRPS